MSEEFDNRNNLKRNSLKKEKWHRRVRLNTSPNNVVESNNKPGQTEVDKLANPFNYSYRSRVGLHTPKAKRSDKNKNKIHGSDNHYTGPESCATLAREADLRNLMSELNHNGFNDYVDFDSLTPVREIDVNDVD